MGVSVNSSQSVYHTDKENYGVLTLLWPHSTISAYLVTPAEGGKTVIFVIRLTHANFQQVKYTLLLQFILDGQH